jgi:hypothetical protein
MCIAFLAKMWVVLVFVILRWRLSLFLDASEILEDRGSISQARLLEVLIHPFDNMRNVYFGMMMWFRAGILPFIELFLVLSTGFCSL